MKKGKNTEKEEVAEQPVKEALTETAAEAHAEQAPAATPKATPLNEEMVHLIVFKLGTEEYAIKIEQVKEVTVTPGITRMPRTPDFIKGVANIRGDIIAVMDLEHRFGIKPAPVEEGVTLRNLTYTLVIEAKEYSLGVVVREVPQSLNLSVTKINRTPTFLQDINISENYIEGIAKVGERLIIVLDMYKILTQDEVKELVG